MLVAGSRPAGQAPAYPPNSSTVSDPPGFGAPVAAAAVDVDDAVELDADADVVDVFELELPHALATAAITNTQAAIAAGLLKRMA